MNFFIRWGMQVPRVILAVFGIGLILSGVLSFFNGTVYANDRGDLIFAPLKIVVGVVLLVLVAQWRAIDARKTRQRLQRQKRRG
jgi:hypothetical protein